MIRLEQAALEIKCPTCGAAIFERCFAYREPKLGLRTIVTHEARIDKWIELQFKEEMSEVRG